MSENAGLTQPEASGEKKRLGKRARIAIIASASVLALALIGLAVFLISYFVKTEAGPREIFVYGDYDYVLLEDGTAQIVGYHGLDIEIVIPSVIEGREVSSIADSAFEGKSSLTKIKLGAFTKRIGSSAFASCTGATEIILPSTLTEIGSYAFFKTSSLKEIAIPESVSSIGAYAFSNSALETVTLPASITALPDGIFYSCKALAEVDLPDGLTAIGNSSLYECKALTSLELTHVVSVGDFALAYCDALESVSFGSSLERLGNNVLLPGEDAALATVTVPADNTHFTTQGGVLVCKDTKTALILPRQSGVTSYVMPDYVEHIADYAFGYSETLAEIILSPNLKTIGYAAFHTDTALARIVLPTSAPETAYEFPATLEHVGGNAFVNARFFKLITEEFTVVGDGILINYTASKDADNKYVETAHTKRHPTESEGLIVTLPEGVKKICSAFSSSPYSIVEFYGSSSLRYIGEYSFYNISALEKIDLSTSSVAEIAEEAFSGCATLKTVLLPETLTDVGPAVFFSCGSLKSITLPSSLSYLSERMFAGCMALSDVKLPENLRSIGTYAFYNVLALKYIDLPDSIRELKDYAFAKTGLREFVVPKGAEVGVGLLLESEELKKITITGSGATPKALCMGAIKLETVIFDGDFTKIGDETFYNCRSLSNITLPEGVTEIGDYAFAQCVSLEGIEISEDITYVGEYAFYYASSLKSFPFNRKLTSISAYAFSKCTSLESADLRFVTTLGRNCFEECRKLTSVDLRSVAYTIPASAFIWCDSLTDIRLADTVTYISESAFMNNAALKSINLPEELTVLGNKAFYNCISLERIGFNDKLTSIGIQTFSTCTSITKLTLPDTVVSIGQNAFENCTALTELTMKDGVTEIGDYAFYGCGALFKIRLSSRLGAISAGTFESTGLVEVVIPDSVRTVGYGAFYNCTALRNVTLSNNLQTVEQDAFGGCSSIHYVYYTAGQAAYESILFGSGNNYLHMGYAKYLER